MSPSHSDSWSKKVGDIFDVRPRVAVDDLSRWMSRQEENNFRAAVVCPGSHVCLYGPSGSGKTSLAKTILARLRKKGYKFIYTRINHNSTWNSFKSQIIENKQTKKDTEKGFGVKIGIKNLLPYIEISGEAGGGKISAIASRAEIVNVLGIPNIAQFCIDSNFIIAMDDINFASEELLLMLTSLAKEIIDNSESSDAKLIFIGADDIFLKIINLNDSLKDRTEEIALGSVREEYAKPSAIKKDRVWKFIADGLVQLGLQDPRSDKRISREQLTDCVEWINHAADGLPKSIVRLGKKIAENGEYRSRISYSDIKTSATEMTQRNFRHYRSRYRTFIYSLRRNKLLQDVCLWMFNRGASRIHVLDDIAEDLHELGTYTHFEDAISELSGRGFVVITGIDKNIFFAQDPLLAHTIGVALKSPEQCGVDKKYFGNDRNVRQLLLRFTGPKDPERRDKI